MNSNKQQIAIVGAGINGLVAANYLQRGGCQVTLIERADRIGGACVSAVAEVGGISQSYALGASVLGLMQDFVFEQTGLAARLRTFVPTHPKYVYFPGDSEPTFIYRDPMELDEELAKKWVSGVKSRHFSQMKPELSHSYRKVIEMLFLHRCRMRPRRSVRC
ncbi:MAG: FAD-dependent oxidoreductase [Proteobacteria bacterium]|nr:FAD-dependent oxidoreductase [Pseudomonadota bacterium]